MADSYFCLIVEFQLAKYKRMRFLYKTVLPARDMNWAKRILNCFISVVYLLNII